MTQLISTSCSACKIDSPLVSDQEINDLQPQIPDWEIIEIADIKRLRRAFKFANFIEAIGFTNQVAEIAEAENHHPEIITEWGNVTVSWWTHKIKGLHLNDFVLAAKTDQLFKKPK